MKITFTNKNNDFVSSLKKNVDEYFKSTKTSMSGNRHLYIKSVILFITAISLYSSLLLFTIPIVISVLLCLSLGFILALIGFNVMHDGAHGSYSKKKWLNQLMGYTLNIMGGSSFLWKQKHNVNHHSFTNISGHDDDIDIRPMMRTNEHQKLRWFHKYQFIYWIFLYGFSYWSFVFLKNFKEYFKGKIGDVKLKKFTRNEHFVFWFSKALYLTLFIVIPSSIVGIVPTLIGYCLMSFSCGLLMAVVFQLAHVVEGTHFPMPDPEKSKIQTDWTTHQIETTANFSTNNKVMSWLLGGLNFQIEHHLFPGISHVHYPALSIKVKETCKEYGIRYIEFSSFAGALMSHVSYLKAIGVR